MAKIKNSKDSKVGKVAEQGEHSSTTVRNANLYNHSGNQFVGLSENWE